MKNLFKSQSALFVPFLWGVFSFVLSSPLQASDEWSYKTGSDPEEKLIELYDEIEDEISEAINEDTDPSFDDSALRNYVRELNSEVERRDEQGMGPREEAGRAVLTKYNALKYSLEKIKSLKMTTELKTQLEEALTGGESWVQSPDDEQKFTKTVSFYGIEFQLNLESNEDSDKQKLSVETSVKDGDLLLKSLGAEDEESALGKYLAKEELGEATKIELLSDIAEILSPKGNLTSKFVVSEKETDTDGEDSEETEKALEFRLEAEGLAEIQEHIDEQLIAESDEKKNKIDSRIEELGDESDPNSDIGDALKDLDHLAEKDEKDYEKLENLAEVAEELKDRAVFFQSKNDLCTQIIGKQGGLSMLSSDFKEESKYCKNIASALKKDQEARNVAASGSSSRGTQERANVEDLNASEAKETHSSDDGASSSPAEGGNAENLSKREQEMMAEIQRLRSENQAQAQSSRLAQIRAACQQMTLSPAAFGAQKSFLKNIRAIKDKISDISLGKLMDVLASKKYDISGDEDSGETPEERAENLLIGEFNLTKVLRSFDLSKIGSAYGTAKDELTKIKALMEKGEDDMASQVKAANTAEAKIAKKEKEIRRAEEEIIDQAYVLAQSGPGDLTQDDLAMASAILADAGNVQPTQDQLLVEAYRYTLRQRARIDTRIEEAKNDRLWLSQYRLSAQKLQNDISEGLMNVRSKLGGIVSNVTRAISGSGGAGASPVTVMGSGVNTRQSAPGFRRKR